MAQQTSGTHTGPVFTLMAMAADNRMSGDLKARCLAALFDASFVAGQSNETADLQDEQLDDLVGGAVGGLTSNCQGYDPNSAKIVA